MNKYSLFWGWNKKDKTIEWIIKNSNNHLYKYANTSLIKHKVTLDNWELSIKEIKLADLINLNYIVFYREIPIINAETNKENNKKIKENSPFSMKNLLEYYFNLYWLEYERVNSIDDFLKTIEELKSITDSVDWQILNVPSKYGQFVLQSIQDKENENELNKLLSTKQRVDNVDYLYSLFMELSSFTTTFEIYVQWVRTQVLKMDEKASW
jgi:predicted RNA-binding protein with RPS1 domain